MTICIGEVVAVEGVQVTLRLFDESNKDILFFNGKRYKGVSIREYLSIQRGFRDIICIIQGEYLDEKRNFEENGELCLERRVQVKPIGYFEHGRFAEGIKFLPMIKDQAFLVEESQVASIFGSQLSGDFSIGRLIKEEIPINLPWRRLFNTHIGIFGNTGSGKSNTLTKLYTTLFEKHWENIRGKSNFCIIDFNGEYTNNQLIDRANKNVITLRTSDKDGDKFPISSAEFWNVDLLAVLFQATSNTQRPFLSRLVQGREHFANKVDSLKTYFRITFRKAFTNKGRPESLDLLRQIARIIKDNNLEDALGPIKWHGNAEKFFNGFTFFESDGAAFDKLLSPIVSAVEIDNLEAFEEYSLRAHLQLTQDLLAGFVQFEHIQPLLKRGESALKHLSKVLHVRELADIDEKCLTVVSLRNCNQEVKKIIPLLIAKSLYTKHRSKVASPPDQTMHLIIDEAHNILSEQSTREHEIWRDYRLELFEEIIKEGRKFGVFITLSSQRPADISPTIVSQLHNFFIHRLVNERDLFLIDNTISTLDSMSKALIPNLSKGCCIVTGTSFDLPMSVQVDLLSREKQPDSEDVDLAKLWMQ